ncbi:MAG: sensor histidine kinase [Alphaproteobacteria bacterium]|nr:sensor histidine kinase [Alphaproteobacteria bacterium]
MTATPDPGEFDEAAIPLLELRHRMKNLIAVVQAVANQTLRSGRSIDEARRALDGRLAAMGQAVDMLLGSGWSAGSLRALIEGALMDEGDRVRIEGPDVMLGADAVMALTLVFHELESNAIKYGALSGHAGRVDVAWCVEDGRLLLSWTEHGGPPCVAPSRQGFGSRMIAKLLGGRFRGSAETDYAAGGLRWRLTAPLEALGG